MDTNSNDQYAINKLNLKKLRLENEKLEQEIKEIKKPWLLKPSNIAPIIAILLTLYGAFYAYKTDFFHNQETFLENKKHDLALGNDKLQKHSDTLKLLIAQERVHIYDSLSKEKVRLIDSFAKKIYVYQNNLDNLQRANNELKEKVLSNEKLADIKSAVISDNKLPNQSDVISGFIQDISNSSIGGADIFIDHKHIGMSDKNGYFLTKMQKGKLSGECEIKITKNGYKPLSIVVSDNTNFPLILRLQKVREFSNEFDASFN